MNSAQNSYGKRSDKLTNAILLGTAIFGLIFSIVGIILLSNYMTYDDGYEIVKDYTNCPSIDKGIKCKDSLNTTGKECACYIQIEITKLMKAPVTVFYELDSYDQISSSYAQSRDDNQLAGNLTPEPAASCGSYSYTNTTTGKKPIAPCGELADAMFNDTFTLQTNNHYILNFRNNLIPEDDKKQFHNPSGNLSQAFKDFSKPINWRKNVWQLDTNNPENNGFQNEAFIIWMNTDLKRKPVWRVNHTGLYEHGVFPANYTLRVSYGTFELSKSQSVSQKDEACCLFQIVDLYGEERARNSKDTLLNQGYPPSRYDGRRKFIISSVHEIVNSVKYGFGVALLVIGLPCFVFAAVLLFIRRSTISWR